MVRPIPQQAYPDIQEHNTGVGTAGVTLDDGYAGYHPYDPQKKTLVQSAQQSVVAADVSNRRRTPFASVGPLADVHTLITDITETGASPEPAEVLQELDVNVIVANPG
jgi:DeoR/GlpR family transcriptional regulator of sugar metabolism